ncbi:ABC transporter, ATPase subunit [Candidatus Koribacter versatilis Ellin345]|uniref:ABC transporter, ATPase subunit n=1 Tax=Koribacter versatilis (strain Ellin345) TaxID=204669 RepID=Q1IRC7_KORVE|nr:ABC transporter ATP-binding protein [Candidatus Koribacter versatilis]ABF40573.1 ABC transporter, ATPase subunit [Candidatus Koribacter versatilis Ellin345]
MFAIETVALEKIYQTGFWRRATRRALWPLSLSVPEHEVFGFLGPNGAGKTTTLKLLMSLIYPTSGEARILGLPVDDPNLKRQIGYSPEQPYFYDHLTAHELLKYYAQLTGVPAKEQSKKVEGVLERVGLRDIKKLQLRKFSKGMLQRVSIAQAIVHDPRIVFLDEPMSGLDPMGRREVRDLIQELKEEGKTIFFSTHILSDAETLCDRVAVVNKGELKGVGSIAELKSRGTGESEILWESAGEIAELKKRAKSFHRSAEFWRAVVPDAEVYTAIDCIRQAKGRLISVTSVRETLEDYFFERLNAPGAEQ